MEHGGDLLSYEDDYSGQLVDFSSNINPLGPPRGLDQMLISSLSSLEMYPDIQYRKLKESLSVYLKCKKENVLVGNGAVEIIDHFIISSKRVILFIPSFSEYEKRAFVHEKIVERISYRKDFTIDIESIEKIIKPKDLLILGNPNNPTGLRIKKDQLIRIYKLIQKKDAYLLLDEAFFEFCPEDYDSIRLFEPYGYQNVGIIRAATKFFALPGIRLGYGCASEEKVKELAQIELPWRVNALGDVAGQFIFKDKDYIKQSKKYIEIEREYVLGALSKIRGVQPFQTDTNYILIQVLLWDEEYIFQWFLKRGLLIRKCSSFLGLPEGYIRVAIKDRKNNKKLIEAFLELSEKGS